MAQGFAVPAPTVETDGRVQDMAGPGVSGPKVDYFPNEADESATQAAENAAKRVAALLNEVKPEQLSPFVFKPTVVGTNQSQSLGVWF